MPMQKKEIRALATQLSERAPCYLMPVPNKEKRARQERELEQLRLQHVQENEEGEFRSNVLASLAAIPGGGTMEKAGQPSRTNPCVRALGMLCARAKYRVAMDADVSADGAVRELAHLMVTPRWPQDNPR